MVGMTDHTSYTGVEHVYDDETGETTTNCYTITYKYPSWCCQDCGEQIGWLGRGLVKLFGAWIHKCKEK